MDFVLNLCYTLNVIFYCERNLILKAKPVKSSLKNSLKNMPEKTARRLSLALCGVLLLLLVLIGLFALLDKKNAPHEVTTYAMGSYVQQTVYGKAAEDAAAAAASAVQLLENEISWRVLGSDVQKINDEAGREWVSVSEGTLELLTLSNTVYRESDGAFDVTIAPVSRLWGFDENPESPPDAEKIEQFLPYVDGSLLRIDEENRFASLKNRSTAVDLGAVGKGAACDAAVNAYSENNAEAAIVSVGGSVGVFGKKPAGGAWRVSVRDPETGGGLGTLSLESGFVSTSGSYEKAFTAGGVTYHHLLDPATGYPAESGLVSVTVKADSGALSDALSTACFVLGLERGTALLETFDAEGIFIDESHTVFVTDGLQKDFTLTADGYTTAA